MLIRDATCWPPGAETADEATLARLPRTDVRLAGGLIAELGSGLCPKRGELTIDAGDGLLLPGLHDHHVHLRATAAAAQSVFTGPPQVRTARDLAARLCEADAAIPPGAWLRGVGYHESVAGDLDRTALDTLVPGRPVRIQHRTGALWMVNSPAVMHLGLDQSELAGVERDPAGRPTGRLWRMDRWLADRVPPTAQDLTAIGRTAAASGITGFTDATPGATASDLAALPAALAQRLYCMAPPGVDSPSPRITVGPEKILLDDTTLPSLDQLADHIKQTHSSGRPVAVHCVTRVQLVLTLTALDQVGRAPGDRVEHGAVIAAGSIPALRGLTVVTQPHFVAERGQQYASDVPPEDRLDLWRLRSLIDAGISVAAGSDTPFGSADPWGAMRAAAHRPRPFQRREALSSGRALALFLGQPADPARQRLVAAGHPADLVLLRARPLEALEALSSDLVASTFIAGELVYSRS